MPARSALTRRLGVRQLAVVAFVAFAALILVVAVAGRSNAASGLTSIDLAKYKRVAKLNLPPQVSLTNQLAEEASGVTYDPVSDSLFVVGDEGTSIVQINKATGAKIDSMTLTGFDDTEGITYVSGGNASGDGAVLVVSEERKRDLVRVTYHGDATTPPVLNRNDASVKAVDLGTDIGNVGNEGASYDVVNDSFLVVKELTPSDIFETHLDFAAGTTSNGPATNDQDAGITPLFSPALAGLRDFSDVYALHNLPTATLSAQRDNVLIDSQESGRVINVSRSGAIASHLDIVDDANALSIPDITNEGVTMDSDANLYVVNENGGGIGVPQLWVYQLSNDTNAAPTAVGFKDVVSSLAENTGTGARVKVAGVTVTDPDGIGNDDISVSGPDAGSFEADRTGLYLKAGTALDYETKTSYSVTVNVDDPTVGSSPDASNSFTLAISDVDDSTATGTSVIVSEISPWSSGDSSYASDWFELTNTGTDTVDISGWKIDDDSVSFTSGAALTGVTKIKPGESAVFLNVSSKKPAFINEWWGGTAPAGVQVGAYDGGPGLGTGGDAVAIFDAAGHLVTGVRFGTSVSGRTFDNSAGLGSTDPGALPAVTTISETDHFKAFESTVAHEQGSPGLAPIAPTVTVSEVCSTCSDDSYAKDWFELTNVSNHAVDLTGWKADDNSASSTLAGTVSGVPATLAPGASAVLVMEGSAAAADAVRSAWFPAGGATTPSVGYVSGSGLGLGGGDEVHVYNGSGDQVTAVKLGTNSATRTFDNAAGVGAFSPSDVTPTISTLSTAGINGALATGAEVGSPGVIGRAKVVITEVSPWSSGSSRPYDADWFEVRNAGSTPVDLSDWTADDNHAPAGPWVGLDGVGTIAPGEVAVFVAGNAAKVTQFVDYWFGGTAPAGLKIGYFDSGLGLGTGGDALHLYDGRGFWQTGVVFGANTGNATFDNAVQTDTTAYPALATPSISTLSVRGAGGARLAGSDSQIGSPGTIAADTTKPVFTIAGNAGSYVTSDTVNITCAVADGALGSGVKTTDCATISGSGASFGVGSHTTTFHALDYAGNEQTADVTFTVALDTDGDGVADSADSDDDNDGIADVLDGSPLTPTTAFNDGAGTSGTITSTGGLPVAISDLAAPNGVLVSVGSGTGQATVSVCGFTLQIAAASKAEVTCGSVKVHTLAGTVKILIGTAGSFVTIPSGATGRVTNSGGGVFKVENLGAGAITETANGVSQTIAAGATSDALDNPTIKAVCALTTSYVKGSAKYQALSPVGRFVVDLLSNVSCGALNAITPRLPAAQRAKVVDAWVKTLTPLQSGGWLTAAQVTTIKALVTQLPA